MKARPHVVLMLLVTVIGLRAADTAPAWTPLFNGTDLSGWDTYVGPHYDAVKQKMAGEPDGLNHDPAGVFSVSEVDGAAAIHVSGEHFGGLSTVAEFENYHLRLAFKWGDRKYVPRLERPRDSGLLYHAVGPPAAAGQSWMQSFEFQIQEHDCGDYWGVAKVAADVPTQTVSSDDGSVNYVYDRAGQLRTFQANHANGRHVSKFPDAERPTGEWNTLDLYCVGDTAMHVVNGVVVMILHHLRQPDDQGDLVPLTRGKVQLQSEGAEVYYRSIAIRPINALPALMVGTEAVTE